MPMALVPGYSEHNQYPALNVPRMYRAAANLIKRRGLAEPGYDIDIDGRYSVDGACRFVVGLPPRFEDIDPDDKFRMDKNNRIICALEIDLRCLPARWTGTAEQTVELLRAAALKRRARARRRVAVAA